MVDYEADAAAYYYKERNCPQIEGYGLMGLHSFVELREGIADQ